jgi:transcriptional regulator with XRE-family HTH domain
VAARADDDAPMNGMMRAFVVELRAWREAAGLTQEQLADLMGFSTSVIGKLETCRTRPSKQHAEKLDQVLRTPGTFVRLREAFFATSAIPDWFREWPDIEADAVTLRWFEALIVPGLLQTQAYARALLRTRPDSTDEEIEAMVAARMDRQAVLAREKPPTLWIVLDEGVLHRPVGGSVIMGEQLTHLAGMARRPNVIVQIVPASVGAYEGLRGPLVLASFASGTDVALQDAALFGQLIESDAGIAAVRAAWDTIKSEALPRSASIELIEKAAERWT